MCPNGSPRSPLTGLRVARDRPFRACGRSPHRERPFRAKMNVPSTPSGKPVGCAPRRLSRSSALCRRVVLADASLPRRQSHWTRTCSPGRTRAGLSRWTLAPARSPEDSLRSSSEPCLAARGSRCSPLASPWPPHGRPRTARQDGARCWKGVRFSGALSLAPRGRSRRRERERTDGSVGRDVEEIRDVVASRCRARERLQGYYNVR
ncbi:hypothetical protein SAMN05216388_101373 [Halorientalis persicus]|uniref:Uncharacterized protein n=1 Tax=Halorientalis persicus TaxID=1367881 RepID=A0A1H8Q5Q8_9EURY|nr:hypothetical protein SAMN05216388_101373 [Halorientalis persicus]